MFDNFLYNLVTIVNVHRRRVRSDIERRVREEPIQRRKHVKYRLSATGGEFEICREGFMRINGVSKRQTERIADLKMRNKVPVDTRGHHASLHRLPAEARQAIIDHIGSFEVKETHYYGGKRQYYLSERLNLTRMYKLFLKKHPNISVSRSVYEKIFKDEFALSFGAPQVDTCCVCEDFNIQLQSTNLTASERSAAITAKLVHQRAASKFHARMREVKTESKNKPEVLGFSIDFMMNLSLPSVPVQEAFYLTKLTVNVFGIHNFKTGHSEFYLYDQTTGGKGANEVCSLLNLFFDEIPSSVKEVYIFSDGCPGQNRNHTLSRFLCTQASRFRTLRHYYPIRGHSFLPNDQDFAIAKRRIAQIDRVYNLREYRDLILEATDVPGRIQAAIIKHSDLLVFDTFWQSHYRKKVIADETRRGKRGAPVPFEITKYYDLSYSEAGIVARQHIHSNTYWTFTLKKKEEPCPMPQESVRKRKLEPQQITSIRKLLRYVPNTRANRNFWNRVFPNALAKPV